jgi:DinB superfamily
MTFDLQTGIQVLERTPRTLNAMLDGLTPFWLDGTEGPDTWSPFIIVKHLIQAERTNWISRAQIILQEGSDRRFRPFDRLPDANANRTTSIGELLSEFAQVRGESLDTLREWRLTDAQLALEGEHPEFGSVTLRQLLATWVAHDLSHIAQISRVMAKQYREAVGPWRAYLRVMERT